MRISTRGRYALRMMIDLARHGTGNQPISLAMVAERTDLSRGYLEQLAQALKHAGLLRSVAGRHGGYRLTRSPAEITIGHIVEASIGPLRIVECIEDPEDCPRAVGCECRIVYELINKRITEVLHEYTLANLLDPSWVHDGELVPSLPTLISN